MGRGKSGAPRRSRRARATVDVDDVRRVLQELADTTAPADLTALLAREKTLRVRIAAAEKDGLSLFARQLAVALECLRDHVAADAPQIPYRTIAILSAAVYYAADSLDLIPDFLPHVGQLDDALVMAMAFELARAGVLRYCTWKGYDPSSVLTPSPKSG